MNVLRKQGITRTRTRTRTSRPALKVELLEKRDLFAADAFAGLIDTSSLHLSPSDYQESRILVRFQSDSVGLEDVAGTQLGRQITAVPDLYEINLENMNVDAALELFRQDPNVLYAERDLKVSLNLVPNDPRFGSLWGLNNTGSNGSVADADIDATESWDLTTSLSEVTVAVIDSGIDYNHPDLKDHIWVNSDELAGNGIDDDKNGYVDDVYGWDFYNDDNVPLDDNAHGTHVAGTIGAVRNNGIGIAGIADNVKLMALKFLGSDGSGYLSDAIAAIDYAWKNGAKIANNSWSGGGYSQSLADAIGRFQQAGGIFVAAAGNEGMNSDVLPNYPSNFSKDNIVAVAASDSSDRLATFSNYGVSTVDIAAPGVNILSTTPGNSYSSFSGTSMATPHVAGAAAILWGQNPNLTYREVIDRLLQNSDPILKDRVVAGRLNLQKSLVTPVADTMGPRVTTTEWLGSSTTSLNRVRLTFDEAIDASSFSTADVTLKRPDGSTIAVSGITKVTDKQFEVTFATQTAAGTYSVSVGPQIQDLKGNLMNQDGDSIMGETLDSLTSNFALNQIQTFTWSGSARIYDYSATSVSISVPSDVVITDLNVKVNLSHTWDSDVRIYLIDPTGASRLLFNRRGGSGDNIFATFDDEATTAISAGRAPFTGSFRPESSLSAFDGKRSSGTWTLRVEDVLGGYTGTINSVSLIVQSGATVLSQTKILENIDFGVIGSWGAEKSPASTTITNAADSNAAFLSAVANFFSKSDAILAEKTANPVGKKATADGDTVKAIDTYFGASDETNVVADLLGGLFS